jgi:murein L,D-transpeptidase YcbB/YkuD
MVTGNGRMVAARINEHGQTTGGAEGDQTGREICQQAYYNYPWDCVLRYQEHGATADHSAGAGNKVPAHSETTIRGIPLVKRGSRGELVRAAQYLLEGRGFRCGTYGADGDFGASTEKATKAFQLDRGLESDGIIGGKTWAALLGVVA